MIGYYYVSIHSNFEPLTVRSRDSLTQAPESAVVLGDAPDGLPLVLHVLRRHSVESAVLGALGYPPRDELAGPISDALTALQRAVASEAKRQGILRVGAASFYRSDATVGTLFGDTMLASTIGAHSPLILAEDRYSTSSQPELVANTAAVALSPDPVTLMKGVMADRYLLVPTASGPVFIAKPDDETDEITEDSLEPLRFEDLRPIGSARFWARKNGEPPQQGLLADEHAYKQAVRENNDLAWTLGVNDIGKAIVQIARSVQLFHDEGRVHGDIKPGNSLITARGGIVIDPIGIEIGKISPGATPGWAAPEQILARPVAPSTDVFALGLMIALVMRAAIYGEERSFVIPTGKEERRRVRLLGDPDVFVDPRIMELESNLRLAWSDLICRSVSFDPDDRPQSAGAFADEVANLLDAQALPGDIAVRGGPGALQKGVEVLGAFQPSWVMTDRR